MAPVIAFTLSGKYFYIFLCKALTSAEKVISFPSPSNCQVETCDLNYCDSAINYNFVGSIEALNILQQFNIWLNIYYIQTPSL